MTHISIRTKIKQHLWGPAGSVCFHIIMVLLIVMFMKTVQKEKGPTIEAVILKPQTIHMDELLKQELPKDLDNLDEPLDMSHSENPSHHFDPVDEPIEQPSNIQSIDWAPVSSVVKMPGPISHRSNRKSLLDKNARGFGRITEPAVVRALEWLQKNQRVNGAWNESQQIGHTGLALLTFLAHGETPGARRYGPCVEKAIKYLYTHTDEQHRFNIPRKSHAGIYEHCIATYAIAEAYSMTRIPGLRDVMEANLQVIVDGQQAGGGWDYQFADEGRTDTSVMGWAVQALKAGTIARATTPGVHDALDKAVDAFQHMSKTSTGRFGYTTAGVGDIGMTGVGVLSLQFMGASASRELARGLAFLSQVPASFDGVSKHPLYAFYYITQARFHAGGEIWQAWNPQIASLLVKHQQKDGSWLEGDEGERRGKVYSTTLAALTLQVYYRNLPTNQPVSRPEVFAEDTEIMISVGDG